MSNRIASAKYRIVTSGESAEIDFAEFMETMSPVMQRQYIAWNILAGYTPEKVTEPNDWLLRKVRTLNTLDILKPMKEKDVEIKERIEEIEKGCLTILLWLHEYNFTLAQYDNRE